MINLDRDRINFNKTTFNADAAVDPAPIIAASYAIDISDAIMVKGIHYAAAVLPKPWKKCLAAAVENASQAFDWAGKQASSCLPAPKRSVQLADYQPDLRPEMKKIAGAALFSFTTGLLFKGARRFCRSAKLPSEPKPIGEMEIVSHVMRSADQQGSCIKSYRFQQMSDRTSYAFVDYIKNNINRNFQTALETLEEIKVKAILQGSDKVRIEFLMGNPRLKNIIDRRYGVVKKAGSSFGKDSGWGVWQFEVSLKNHPLYKEMSKKRKLPGLLLGSAPAFYPTDAHSSAGPHTSSLVSLFQEKQAKPKSPELKNEQEIIPFIRDLNEDFFEDFSLAGSAARDATEKSKGRVTDPLQLQITQHIAKEEHANFIQTTDNILAGIQVAQQAMQILGASRNTSLFVHSFGQMVHIARNMESFSFGLSQGISAASLFPHLASVACSVLGIFGALFGSSKKEDRSMQELADFIYSGFKRLSEQIALYHQEVMFSLEGADVDRQRKHDAVLNRLIQVGLGQAEVKHALEACYKDLQESQNSLQKSIQRIGDRMIDFYSSLAAFDQNGCVTDAQMIINEVKTAVKFGALTDKSFVKHAGKLESISSIIAKSDPAVGTKLQSDDLNIAFNRENSAAPDYTRAYFQIRRLQHLLEKHTGVRAAIPSNPLLWGWSVQTYLQMLDEAFANKEVQLLSPKVKEANITLLEEFADEGRRILQFHEQLYSTGLLKSLIDQHASTLDGLKESLDVQLHTYEDMICQKIEHLAQGQYDKDLAELQTTTICDWSLWKKTRANLYPALEREYLSSGWNQGHKPRRSAPILGQMSAEDKKRNGLRVGFSNVYLKFRNDPYADEIINYWKASSEESLCAQRRQVFTQRKAEWIHSFEHNKVQKKYAFSLFGENAEVQSSLSKIIIFTTDQGGKAAFPLPAAMPKPPDCYLQAELLRVGRIRYDGFMPAPVEQRVIITQKFMYANGGEEVIQQWELDYPGALEHPDYRPEERIFDMWLGGHYSKNIDQIELWSSGNGASFRSIGVFGPYPPLVPYEGLCAYDLSQAKHQPPHPEKIEAMRKSNKDAKQALQKEWAARVLLEQQIAKKESGSYDLINLFSFLYGPQTASQPFASLMSCLSQLKSPLGSLGNSSYEELLAQVETMEFALMDFFEKIENLEFKQPEIPSVSALLHSLEERIDAYASSPEVIPKSEQVKELKERLKKAEECNLLLRQESEKTKEVYERKIDELASQVADLKNIMLQFLAKK